MIFKNLYIVKGTVFEVYKLFHLYKPVNITVRIFFVASPFSFFFQNWVKTIDYYLASVMFGLHPYILYLQSYEKCI